MHRLKLASFMHLRTRLVAALAPGRVLALAGSALALGLGLAPAPLLADTRIGSGRGVVDEIIVDTTTIAPVRAALPFSGFRYPHVDAAENVTFIADDPFYFGADKTRHTHGIYRSEAATGELRRLVGPDTPLPGGGHATWIRGLQSDRDEFVFHARVGFPDETRRDALFHWSPARGLALLARQGDAAPGGGSFKKLGYAALDDDHAVFTGLDDQNAPGLFLADLRAGRAERLARGGDAAPFRLFWFQPWMSDGVLAFGALDPSGREGLWFATPPPLPPAGPPPPQAFERLDLAALPVPEGVVINFVESTATSRGWLAFNAGHAPDPDRKGYGGAFFKREHSYKGVFLVREGRALNLVDTETFIPGREVTFANFDFWTTCDLGRVVFVARGPDDFAGIYLYDAAEATLHELITTDDTIEGRRPRHFEIGSRPLVGERCAFTAWFGEGETVTGGVYLATLTRTEPRPLRRKP